MVEHIIATTGMVEHIIATTGMVEHIIIATGMSHWNCGTYYYAPINVSPRGGPVGGRRGFDKSACQIPLPGAES